jgi:hypothetical protein
MFGMVACAGAALLMLAVDAHVLRAGDTRGATASAIPAHGRVEDVLRRRRICESFRKDAFRPAAIGGAARERPWPTPACVSSSFFVRRSTPALYTSFRSAERRSPMDHLSWSITAW